MILVVCLEKEHNKPICDGFLLAVCSRFKCFECRWPHCKIETLNVARSLNSNLSLGAAFKVLKNFAIINLKKVSSRGLRVDYIESVIRMDMKIVFGVFSEVFSSLTLYYIYRASALFTNSHYLQWTLNIEYCSSEVRLHFKIHTVANNLGQYSTAVPIWPGKEYWFKLHDGHVLTTIQHWEDVYSSIHIFWKSRARADFDICLQPSSLSHVWEFTNCRGCNIRVRKPLFFNYLKNFCLIT